MKEIKILWADDEIDLLLLQVRFLEAKGYKVTTATNGIDAIELCKNQNYDIIFLDENMPGLSGLNTLNQIKSIIPSVPVIMITKSEEENIMDQAIGSKIADYLIKPVNPNQILLAIKKNVDNKRLVTQKTTSDYQAEFRNLINQINECRTYTDWIEVYKKLVYWELELETLPDNTLDEVLKMQKTEANSAFAKFIKNNYSSWFDKKTEDKPLLSPNIFRNLVVPLLKEKKQVFFLLIDNLRYDQWKTIQPEFDEHLQMEKDLLYFSILPTSTQYARNAIFSGLMPSDIDKIYPNLWLNDDEEGAKNINEEELIVKQMSRLVPNIKIGYEKITNIKAGKKVVDNLSNLLDNQLNVIVYNFIDMLSHARTEMDMIKELASDEAAFRSLSLSWVQHSPIIDLIKELTSKNVTVIITTDHGTIRVSDAIKVIGDRNTTTNLRYKQGRNLNYNPKEVFEITHPEKVCLPTSNLSSTYIFATNNDFFAYPNNFHHYVKYYKDTFQHGGVSLEEMVIPLAVYSSK